MAKAPEKKEPSKPKANPRELVPYVADLVVVHQFYQAVHSAANPAIANELSRAIGELAEALNNA